MTTTCPACDRAATYDADADVFLHFDRAVPDLPCQLLLRRGVPAGAALRRALDAVTTALAREESLLPLAVVDAACLPLLGATRHALPRAYRDGDLPAVLANTAAHAGHTAPTRGCPFCSTEATG